MCCFSMGSKRVTRKYYYLPFVHGKIMVKTSVLFANRVSNSNFWYWVLHVGKLMVLILISPMLV